MVKPFGSLHVLRTLGLQQTVLIGKRIMYVPVVISLLVGLAATRRGTNLKTPLYVNALVAQLSFQAVANARNSAYWRVQSGATFGHMIM